MDKFDTKQAAQNLLRTLTGATGNTIGPIQYSLDAAYRAGMERAGEIAAGMTDEIPDEGACLAIADAIRKEAAGE